MTNDAIRHEREAKSEKRIEIFLVPAGDIFSFCERALGVKRFLFRVSKKEYLCVIQKWIIRK